MKRLALLAAILGLALPMTGCAVYGPPNGYPAPYYGYGPYFSIGLGYRPYGYYGYRPYRYYGYGPRYFGWGGGYVWRGHR